MCADPGVFVAAAVAAVAAPGALSCGAAAAFAPEDLDYRPAPLTGCLHGKKRGGGKKGRGAALLCVALSVLRGRMALIGTSSATERQRNLYSSF